MMKRIYLLLLASVIVIFAEAKDRDRNASTTPKFSETAISAGFNHTMIIEGGQVFAWGDNTYGQLGDGTTAPSGIGVSVLHLDHIIAVSAGRSHSMALRADGQVFAWGDNAQLQLGQFIAGGSLVPIQVPGLTDIIDIQAGDNHCLALKSDGTVISWGANSNGELGRGFNTPAELPGNVLDRTGTLNLSGITLISAGSRHSLAILDGNVLVWGDNRNTQAGIKSTTTSVNVPRFVRHKGSFSPGKKLENVISLSAGETHTMAVNVKGQLLTWGEGVFGQLGIGGTIDPTVPTTYTRRNAIVVANGVRTIAAGTTHSMYVDSKGILNFFGTNFLGQLGIPSTTTRVVTPATVGYNSAVALACGGDFTLVMKSDGTIWGAGDNANNQFGPVGSPATSVFTSFYTKTGKIAQVANQLNSFILKADGTVWSMGEKKGVGFASAADVLVATQIPTLNNIIALGGTNENAFALDVSGQVWAWGENQSGVCGTGSAAAYYTAPVLIPTITDIVYIEGSVQGSYSCSGGGFCSHASAIDINGDLYTWGNNDQYELGDGTNVSSSTPVLVTAPGKVFATSLAIDNTFALYADNTIQSWGKSSYDGSVVYGPNATPKIINSTSKFKSISASRNIRMALSVNGNVEVWGYASNSPNFFAICNKSDPRKEFNPSVIFESPGSSVVIQNVKYIESGDDCAFLIKSDGSTWAWGRNVFNELGRGYASTEEDIPGQVSCNAPGYSVAMYHTISAETHVLANRATYMIESWGANADGSVGTGSTAYYETVCNYALRRGLSGSFETEQLEEEVHFSVYPNPAHDQIHVDIEQFLVSPKTVLQIINATGRVIHEVKNPTQSMDISVNHFDEGFYILFIQDEKSTYASKFLIQ